MPIHLGVVSLELHVPGARGLKDKRRAVRSLIDRMHRRYRVSVAETGYQDLHQRAEVNLAVVASDGGELERLLDNLRGIAEDNPEAVLMRWEPRILDEETLAEADLLEAPGGDYLREELPEDDPT
jgi:uncharacterized protein YlxP (DUF503 family)